MKDRNRNGVAKGRAHVTHKGAWVRLADNTVHPRIAGKPWELRCGHTPVKALSLSRKPRRPRCPVCLYGGVLSTVNRWRTREGTVLYGFVHENGEWCAYRYSRKPGITDVVPVSGAIVEHEKRRGVYLIEKVNCRHEESDWRDDTVTVRPIIDGRVSECRETVRRGRLRVVSLQHGLILR